MTHRPHDIAAEFPDDVTLLHQLRTTKGYFAALADRYHEVNHAITRIEAELDPASDARTEDLKKERLALLDQIAMILRDAKEVAA